jgi:preprotein translocase subunit SecY
MTSELARRIIFTLGALLIYRLGTYIPLPGINPSVWEQIFRSQAGGVLGMFDTISGGGIHRMAIFALGLMPYLSAAILMQVLTIILPKLRALRKQGERGRRTVDTYTVSLTLIFSLLQSYGIAIGLEGAPNLVAEPGWLFRTSTVLTLTGGVMVLVWLTGQISARGIGNGVTLILFAGIVAGLPSEFVNLLELGRQGVLSNGMVLALLAFAVALTALVVVAERARRRVPIGNSQGAAGQPQWQLQFKLNSAGIMPTVFAGWILALPMAIAASWWSGQLGRPLFLIVYAILIIGCTFFYTAFLVDPDDVAERLRQRGGSIPGVAPGDATAEHIDFVMSRVTTIGALYLTLVYLAPAVLAASVPAPFYFGGASLLIVVCAILDLEDHVRAFASIKSGAQPQ